jgi:protein-S-isoprenylcysteine O-methyltransferase Ste14
MAWLNKGIDFLALWFAILFFPVPIYWLVIHPAIHFWRRFGNRSFWVALPLWVLSGIVLVLLRHRIFTARIGQNAMTWILGLSLLLVGVWISRLVHHELGLRRLLGLPEISPDRYAGGVVQSGIYAHVRHPRYLGLMLVFLGLALLTAAVGFFLLAIVTVLLYYIVAPLEERELRQQYGSQYEAYARTVPRFVPRLGRKTKPQEL